MVEFSFDYRLLAPLAADRQACIFAVLNIDLQSHSNFSDGTLAPGELVARAAGRSVEVLALTDHDDTSGLDEAQCAARDYDIKLVNGVEISVTWKNQTIHVVGLGINPADEALQSGLAATREGRLERSERMSAAFDEMGIEGEDQPLPSQPWVDWTAGQCRTFCRAFYAGDAALVCARAPWPVNAMCAAAMTGLEQWCESQC